MDTMILTTIKVEKVCRERINVFKDKYGLTSQSDVINSILDFIEKYDINIFREYSNNGLENIEANSNTIISICNEIRNKIIESISQEDKNTTRIIKILQAQERDLFKPLLLNKIETETEKIVKTELVQNNHFDNASETLNTEKQLKKLEDKIYLLNNEIASLKQENDTLKKGNDGSNNEDKLQRILATFNKSMINKRYSSSLSEEEFNYYKG